MSKTRLYPATLSCPMKDKIQPAKLRPEQSHIHTINDRTAPEEFVLFRGVLTHFPASPGWSQLVITGAIILETVEMGIESGHASPVLNAVRIWILISALLVSSGWIYPSYTN
jgi:hypothetical protein